jgi:hypothetical protein
MRTHIAKALQTRSQAIRNALERYNAAANKLQPPREQLTYRSIIEYSFIGDFSLLKASRQDIRLQDWARPAVREAMRKHFQLLRAQEEIVRLNVEIRRLHTAVRDESQDVARCIKDLTTSSDTLDVLLVSVAPLLASEVCTRWQLKSRVNELHVHRLESIERTPGFNGTPGCGVQKGHGRNVEADAMVVDRDLVVDELSKEPGGQYSDDELLHDFERLTILVTELD